MVQIIVGKDLALLCARLCAERKATDVLVLDVRGITDIADYFVLASVETRVQMRAILQAIRDETRRHGVRQFRVEGEEAYSWVLMDFFDCVVHLFTPEARAFYELETLWGDGKVVPLPE